MLTVLHAGFGLGKPFTGGVMRFCGTKSSPPPRRLS